MTDSTKQTPSFTIGLDIGSRVCHYAILDSVGNEVESGKLVTRKDSVDSFFRRTAKVRVVLETCTESGWISRIIESRGHEAIVAHSRSLRAICDTPNKSDRIDAKTLAQLAFVDDRIHNLKRVKPRGAEAHAHLSILRARDAMVAARTGLVNHVRSVVKSCGLKIPGSSTRAFPDRAKENIPEEVHRAILPVIESIRELGVHIRDYDRQVVELCKTRYPETEFLRQVTGVGYLTALAFVLVIENPHRFARSRQVGAYLGLVPARDQSGQWDPQLGITKCGNSFLRRLLVGSAQYILGPFNKEDSHLKEYGLGICQRGGKNAKRRAVVAVARKLAVLLHHLWVSGEKYDPLRNAKSKGIPETTGSPASREPGRMAADYVRSRKASRESAA